MAQPKHTYFRTVWERTLEEGQTSELEGYRKNVFPTLPHHHDSKCVANMIQSGSCTPMRFGAQVRQAQLCCISYAPETVTRLWSERATTLHEELRGVRGRVPGRERRAPNAALLHFTTHTEAWYAFKTRQLCIHQLSGVIHTVSERCLFEADSALWIRSKSRMSARCAQCFVTTAVGM